MPKRQRLTFTFEQCGVEAYLLFTFVRLSLDVRYFSSSQETTLKLSQTGKRAVAKALQLEGHPDFAPVDLAYYQHFLGFFVRKYCVLGSSAWQPQMQTCLFNVDKGRGAT